MYVSLKALDADTSRIAQVLDPAVREIVRRRRADPKRDEKEDLLSLCMPLPALSLTLHSFSPF